MDEGNGNGRKAVVPTNDFIKAIAENRAFESKLFENPILQVVGCKTKYPKRAFDNDDNGNDGAIAIATAPVATETVAAAIMLSPNRLTRRRRFQQRRPQEERRRDDEADYRRRRQRRLR